MVKGGKKGKSERVAERKKKEEDSEGPAEVTTVGLLRGVGKTCPGFAMGGFHQGGGCWLCCGRLPPERSVGSTGRERR